MSELCPDEAAPSRTPRRVPFTDARRIAPARRFCRACHRDKTGASFAPGETRCRKCVRDGNEIQPPKPVSRKMRRDAEKARDLLRAKTGETTLDVYRCGECGWLHVGKSRFRRAQ